VKSSFSINNSDIAYLIHGQYFRLDYNVSNCFLLIFVYDNGEKVDNLFYPQKKTGIFNAIYLIIISPFINLVNPIYWFLQLIKVYKKLYFKKTKGKFENLTNSYNPNLKIIALGWGIKVFRFRLKINFINSKPPEIEVNPIKKPEVAKMDIHFKLPKFSLPSFNKSRDINLQLDKKSLIINDHTELDKLIFDSKNN
jgi:hypothetical protein